MATLISLAAIVETAATLIVTSVAVAGIAFSPADKLAVASTPA